MDDPHLVKSIHLILRDRDQDRNVGERTMASMTGTHIRDEVNIRTKLVGRAGSGITEIRRIVSRILLSQNHNEDIFFKGRVIPM